MEMLKALSAVSLDHSLLRVSPLANKWLLAGVALPTALHLGLLYVPAGVFFSARGCVGTSLQLE